MSCTQCADTPREQTAMELTSWMVHKHYCENDVEAVISLLDSQVIWLGAGEYEYAAGLEQVAPIFRQFAGRIPRCSISDEEYSVCLIAPDICLCCGRMWVATDPSTQISLRAHQRITTLFRWTEGKPSCCHIHLSNPCDDMVEEDVGFPTKMARQTYQYLQEQLHAQKAQLAAQTASLQRLSYVDSLTGLLNRNRYHEMIGVHRDENCRRLGIAYFDLNNLKQINDRLGHLAGDDYLRRTAEQIRRVFEGKAYRTGGDEFVVVDGELEEEAFRAAVRIVQNGLVEEGISCSVGISWRSAGCSFKEQLDEADRLMYQEKRRFYSLRENDRRHR